MATASLPRTYEIETRLEEPDFPNLETETDAQLFAYAQKALKTLVAHHDCTGANKMPHGDRDPLRWRFDTHPFFRATDSSAGGFGWSVHAS